MSIAVTILGNASAKPTAHAHPSAQTVNINEQLFLVDAGEGVQRQMFRYGISPLKLRAVFISHLHGDHVFGLFPLLSTLGLYGRRTPLRIYAPRPFGDMLEAHLRLFDRDLPYTPEWVEVDTTKNSMIFENDTVEVWSLPLRHRVPTAGYLFRQKRPRLNIRKFCIERYGLSIAQIAAAKRGEDIVLDSGETLRNTDLTYLPYQPAAYAYCSDTNYSARLAGMVEGVDLLYHEATYAADARRIAKERGHSTTADAATVAAKASAKRLIIGHFSSRYKDLQPLLEEARAIFPATDIAREGETFTIEPERHDKG
ncbi:ribonuclease Z [Alistipes sp. Z76]|nr:ribonuclease Z [Alistipes sp. Z76]NCE68006.1 ribonuclease Z [Muribaculaceae bacterium M3]